MSSGIPRPANEPSSSINITHTETYAPVYRVSYPPRTSLKRRASQAVNQRFNFPFKRRRTVEPVSCPCVPPPRYVDTNLFEAMSLAYEDDPAAGMNSADSSPPSHWLRGTSLIGKLKNVFRKDSLEAEDRPSRDIPISSAHGLTVLDDPHDRNQLYLGQAEMGEMLHAGQARFSNVSLLLDLSKDIGESSQWYKQIDPWIKYDEPAVNPKTPTAATNRESGAEDRRWRKLKRNSQQSPERGPLQKQLRHKSSLGDAWKALRAKTAKRPSEKSQGKRPQLCGSPGAPYNTPDSALHPFTKLTTAIPPTLVEELLIAVSSTLAEIPQASYSSSHSSTASARIYTAESSSPHQSLWSAADEWQTIDRTKIPPGGSVAAMNTAAAATQAASSATHMLPPSSLPIDIPRRRRPSVCSETTAQASQDGYSLFRCNPDSSPSPSPSLGPATSPSSTGMEPLSLEQPDHGRPRPLSSVLIFNMSMERLESTTATLPLHDPSIDAGASGSTLTSPTRARVDEASFTNSPRMEAWWEGGRRQRPQR